MGLILYIETHTDTHTRKPAQPHITLGITSSPALDRL